MSVEKFDDSAEVNFILVTGREASIGAASGDNSFLAALEIGMFLL